MSRPRQTATLLVLALLSFISIGARQPAPAPAHDTHFVAMDLFIDPSGRPLAAYQVEITSVDGPITTLVGVEGGEGAYSAAPYYDPEALHAGAGTPASDRVVLAAIADTTSAGAPAGESRIARLHYMVEGDAAPNLSARLIVAGVDERTPIDAALRLVPVPITPP